MRAAATRPVLWRSPCFALAALALFASAASAAGEDVHADALDKLAELRSRGICPVGQTDDSVREILFQRRPAVEIKARERGGESAGKVRELAIFDITARRTVLYVCFANASTRRTGEPIISLSEVSTRADRLAGAVFPAANLDLESIQRYRMSGQESVYYEARYTPTLSEHPFFEPPVRLLLNATTGSLFRLDTDPEGLDATAPPRARISRRAAERIASVVMRARDLDPVFGRGAVFIKVGAAELFFIRPNGWLGIHLTETAENRLVAWVVPVQIGGGAIPGTHNLFVDAASGRVLGGREGPGADAPPR